MRLHPLRRDKEERFALYKRKYNNRFPLMIPRRRRYRFVARMNLNSNIARVLLRTERAKGTRRISGIAFHAN